jgi:trigger factor
LKSTVEQLSPTRVKINVEVPFDELKPNFDRAYRKIAQQVRIPGFRPGKAPARVLESRIGRAPVLDEVVNEAIPAKYLEAVRAGEVRTLGQPDFEVTKLEDREVLEFSAEVDVRPEITLPDLDDLTVSVDEVEVTDEEVAAELEQLRARFGTLTGVERPAQDGDFVSIDLSATVDGAEVEEAATSGLSYEIGSGQLVDGIDEAIIGANAGETKTFTTKLVAGQYAGQDADVSVTVQSIKERELPEADDEFAQLASEFDTLDELQADLRERLARMKKVQQGVQARDKILDSLLESVDVPLPEKVVEAEVESRKHDAVHELDHSEEALAALLESEGKTLDEFNEEVRAESEKAVRTQLLLDTIADAEQTSVNDAELTERILYQAQRFGISPDEYVQRAQQSGQLSAIYADVRRGKALASVVRRATVTDASGAEVDLDELFGTGEAADEVAEVAETAAAPEAGEAGVTESAESPTVK